MPNSRTTFDIAQLDAAFHLRALGPRLVLRSPMGVPEWDGRTKRLLAAWLLGARDGFGAEVSVEELENEIRRVFGAKFAITVGSGREAIKLALLGLGLQPGERVVLPSFCCFSVLLPVVELGLQPVLADVGDNLQIDPASVTRVMRPGDRVLIVPHLFGGLADLSQLVEIARAKGAAVIDDAAQAIGRRGDWGWAGRGGDAGIFSFGLFKPLNALGGGALLTDDEQLYARARQAIAGVPSRDMRRAAVLKTWFKVVWRKVTYRVFLHHRLRQQRTEVAGGGPIVPNRHVSPIKALNARLAVAQLAGMASLREQSAILAQRYAEALADLPMFDVPGRGACDGFPRFAIRLADDQPTGVYPPLFAALLRKGIEVQPTYRPLSRLLREMGHEPQGEFFRSEMLAERIFCLPFSSQGVAVPLGTLRQCAGLNLNQEKSPAWP
ncbi:MAG: DegT/DnrJ/EryC1/StrS family aminotransferase [Desulfobulbus sp.]